VALIQEQIYDIRPTEIEARESDDDSVALLWFADRQSDTLRYVCLSRLLDEDKIHIERDDQKWSSYDGLALSMDEGVLSIQLGAPTSERLGGIKTIRVDCRSVTEDTIERVEKVLKEIVASQPGILKSAL
jgi:hypothetical protein